MLGPHSRPVSHRSPSPAPGNARYGVLKGRAVAGVARGSGYAPLPGSRRDRRRRDFRIAVNVKSQLSPVGAALPGRRRLPPSRHGRAARRWRRASRRCRQQAGSGGLDFIRGNLFDRRDMRSLPPNVPGPDNDLTSWSTTTCERAIARHDRAGLRLRRALGARERASPTRSSGSRPATASTTST